MSDKFIDVDKVFEEKNPKVYRWMPGFFMRYLRRIVHQDEINQLLYENQNLYDTDFCEDIINRWDISLQLKGLENIPQHGGVIFAVNHPLGGMDAIALAHAVAPFRKDMKFLVNDILLNLDNLKNLFVGVNKVGPNAPKSLKGVNELFASDHAIFLFPAGYVSRIHEGKIRDFPWKKTFITRSKRNELPVIPVFIDGRLRPFFYNLYRLRTFLGIKANVEMLWLANELYKQHGKTINITFGEPISHNAFDDTRSDMEWAQWVRSKVYNLS